MLGWNGWSRLAALLTALTAIAALWFTAQSLRTTQNQVGLTEQTQFTDRFVKAVELLGSDKLDVRLGGIYALERLARDSERDHRTIMEVLSGFVRTHAPATSCPDSIGPNSVEDLINRPESFTDMLAIKPAVDVQAALTAIGRRIAEHDSGLHLDLSRTCLAGADLSGANLVRADFSFANMMHSNLANSSLAGADLVKANLIGVNLSGSHLAGAMLGLSDLAGADLSKADLTDAQLNYAQLVGADLAGARLTNADLSSASDMGWAILVLIGYLPREPGSDSVWDTNLTRADLSDADLTNANLDGANFTEADLVTAHFDGAQLSGADFTNAWLPRDAPRHPQPR